MAKRRSLTDEELADAARAKVLWLSHQRKNPGVTQDDLAHALGITQGAVGHFLNGIVPIPMDKAIALAKYFSCSLQEISPRFADLVGSVRITPKARKYVPTNSVYVSSDKSRKAPIIETKVHKGVKKNLKVKSGVFRE